jgi:hypothetical protein
MSELFPFYFHIVTITRRYYYVDACLVLPILATVKVARWNKEMAMFSRRMRGHLIGLVLDVDGRFCTAEIRNGDHGFVSAA